MAALSRKLCRSFLTNYKPCPHHLYQLTPFCTNNLSSNPDSDLEESTINSDSDIERLQPPSSATSSAESTNQRTVYDRPLENGLDVGIYKAIVVGQVGQNPLQKRLRSGRTVTLISVGTGGIRNNRRPLENEEPREYANRCAVQWHRVSVYPERLGAVVMKHALPGSILYLEGNLETKIFTDPTTGLVRRVREVAIRRNGRLVFLGRDGGDTNQPTQMELKRVGYY